MEYKWEAYFAEPGPNSRERIRVTLNREGHFYLNRVALRALGDPDAIQLMFDPRKSVIGMLRASIEKPGVYKLRRKHESLTRRGKLIYANSFCRKYNLFPKQIMLFIDPQPDRDGILVLDLNQVTTARRKRSEPAG